MKKTYKRLALILGDQLFPEHSMLHPGDDTLFFMAEDNGLCTHFKYHKHKLILFLSAMRSHSDQLKMNFDLKYFELTEGNSHLSYEEKLDQVVGEYDIDEIVTYEISDRPFRDRIINYCDSKSLKISFATSPSFFTKPDHFEKYLEGVKKPFMHTFYQRQRREMNLLVDQEGKPNHGKWSFDEDNRKKLPKNTFVPARPVLEQTNHTKDVSKLVNELFSDHPGETENFNWHTTREGVLGELKKFLEEKFNHFGPYEDSIEPNETFLFHSTLSPYINMGLITPSEVIDEVIKCDLKEEVHYPSLEGFVRQVIGWREFIKGIYDNYEEKLKANFFQHKNKMNACWYDGTTGIKPLDDSIKKATEHGYTHHIERLMILGNFMLLSEIDPDEVNRWFMEMYVDSADWVMIPNVYGMSQFADGGIFATKPYVAGANYILKMSHYNKNEGWVEVANGLYWRFIDRQRGLFNKNPRMSMMTRTLDKMDEVRKERLFRKAEEFINRTTNN